MVHTGRWCTTQLCTIEEVHNEGSTNPDGQTARRHYKTHYFLAMWPILTQYMGKTNANVHILFSLNMFVSNQKSMVWFILKGLAKFAST